MFHFPGFASRRRYSADYQFKTDRVSPFGHLRIKGYKPPPRSFSQVSRVLHSRPRPRHPPCTLMSLVRRPIHHNHYLQFDTLMTARHESFNSPATKSPAQVVFLGTTRLCVFVCQRFPCLQKRKPPQGAVFERFATRGPYGLSAPKNGCFRFVDT